jgi:hypothetical protein
MASPEAFGRLVFALLEQVFRIDCRLSARLIDCASNALRASLYSWGKIHPLGERMMSFPARITLVGIKAA